MLVAESLMGHMVSVYKEGSKYVSVPLMSGVDFQSEELTIAGALQDMRRELERIRQETKFAIQEINEYFDPPNAAENPFEEPKTET